MSTDIDYTLPREGRHDYGEHEMHFAFNSDEGAEAFTEWWYAEGGKAFAAFVAQRDEMPDECGECQGSAECNDCNGANEINTDLAYDEVECGTCDDTGECIYCRGTGVN